MKWLALILILLAGCQFGSQKKETFEIPEIHSGTEGLVMEFIENAPPKETYERSLFPIVVEMKNRGAYEIRGGIFTVGYENQYMSIKEQDVGRFDLPGKTMYNPEGEFIRIPITAEAKQLGPQQTKYDSALSFNACYAYRTEASAFVCVDTDLLGQNKNKVCSPSDVDLKQGQGAPIAITSLETRMLPSENPAMARADFIIHFDNLGTGEPMSSREIVDACTGKPVGEWGTISIASARLSEKQLQCNPKTIKLGERDNKMVCSVEVEKIRGTYNAPVRIDLDYGYMQTINTGVAIVKVT